MNDFFEGLNPVEHWLKYDKELVKIINEIENIENDFSKQAELAFHKISEEYNLPKMPIDINESYKEDQKSVYEILGLVNYVLEDEDPRSNVLFAICCVYYDLELEEEDFWRKANEEGYNQNNVLGIGYLGDNYNVKIKFVLKGETWSDYGFNLFTKFVYTNFKDK